MTIEMQGHQRLGNELVRRGLLKSEGLSAALKTQKERNHPLAHVLIESGAAKAEDVIATLASILRLPVVDLKRQQPTPEALRFLPERLARHYHAFPVALQGNVLLVAVSDPEDFQAQEELQAQVELKIQAAVANPIDIASAIDRYYKATAGLTRQLENYVDIPSGGDAALARRADRTASTREADTPVTRALDLLLQQAVKDRASDIHIEPQPDRVRVRYRIDGALHDVLSLPVATHAPLISRIKILAEMNIAERRLPQDGHFSFTAGTKEVDVRVASLETSYGERLALRLLDKVSAPLTIPDLGFLTEAQNRFETMLKMPHGLIVVSGPTGSGKTTTLYAALNTFDAESRNIVTIEDPVEYRFLNINQVQVNNKAGLTFANGLRALMRHDPNVILIGEIRDSETAQIAVQAALTGQLVLSTIHANDTEGVVHRLLNLGADPLLVASALVGVVAQRLVRRVCPDCGKSIEVPIEEQYLFEQEMHARQIRFKRGEGCETCAGTGYRGRAGIFEVMQMTENLRRVILTQREPGAIRQEAIKEGMTTMLHDGLIKAKDGLTAISEVMRSAYTVE